ncbi:hypothetical protein ACFFVJ_09915 [Roseibium salinum]|uniref:hypothetical protein n=1 Tax=Roseibium salinum TaxID=1604349 RepID=UPI0035EA840F
MYEKKREGGCAAKRDWPLTESGGKKQAGSRLPASSSIQALTTHYLTISVPIQSQKPCQFVFGGISPDVGFLEAEATTC